MVCAREFGCIVKFYNDVKGLVPRNELSSEPISCPDKVFHEGQVINVYHAFWEIWEICCELAPNMDFPLEEPGTPRGVNVLSLQVVVVIHLNRLRCERDSSSLSISQTDLLCRRHHGI